jgi:hypothetical protein
VKDEPPLSPRAELLLNLLGIARWIVGTVIVYHFAVKYW